MTECWDSVTGFPLHAAFFVPPYSSYTSVDAPQVSTTAVDTTWQQTLQRHWESVWQNKISGLDELPIILEFAKPARKI